MLASSRKRDLFKRADSLAEELLRGEVSRAELRPVLNALFLAPQAWPERFRQAAALNETLPESWVTERSGRSRPQYARVRAALRVVFREGYDQDELRFLLGWATRLIQSKLIERQIQIQVTDRARRTFRPKDVGAPDSTSLIREGREE